VCAVSRRLTEIDEALIQQAQLRSMAKPSQKNLDARGDWLDRDGYGNMFLLGDPEGVWDKEKAVADFMTFQNTADAITESFSGWLVRAKRYLTSAKKPKYHVYRLEDSSRASVAHHVATVISSVFPVLPVVILFFVPRAYCQAWLDSLVFTGGFAAVLVFGMNMASEKVLAVTTA
jgi:hypothetical protein